MGEKEGEGKGILNEAPYKDKDNGNNELAEEIEGSAERLPVHVGHHRGDLAHGRGCWERFLFVVLIIIKINPRRLEISSLVFSAFYTVESTTTECSLFFSAATVSIPTSFSASAAASRKKTYYL